MEIHLEVLLKLSFFTKPLNFEIEARMKGLAGVAISDLMGLVGNAKRKFPQSFLYKQYMPIK
jgi:hypothetical protein